MTFMPNRGLRRRSTRLQRLARRLPHGVKLRAILLALGAIVVMAVLVLLARMAPASADPARAQAEVAISAKLLAQGNATAARSHALTATKADPTSARALAALATSYLALDQGAAGEAAVNRAVVLGFSKGRARALLAQAWLIEGDNARALAAAKRADPRDATAARRIAALALAASGNRVDGHAAMLGLIRATGGRNVAAWVGLGRIRFQMGDVAGALAAADRALALNRGDVDALVLKGELVRGQYGLIASLAWFEAALKVDPWRHAALIQYAATLGDAGRYTAMLDASRRALQASPGSADALYLQAVLAARAGEDDLARALLQRTGAALNGKAGPLLLAGMLDYSDGSWQQAIARWRSVLSMQPMNLTARRLLGAALYKSGDARTALETLRPMALRGDADSYTLGLVGRAFELTGERDWAARFLDRAAIPATDPPTPFGTDAPLDDLQAAADRASADPVPAITYIRALIDAGQNDAALVRAADLAARYPGAPAAHLLVGDILAQQNRLADASAAYRLAANLRFDEATMLRLVDTLDRLGKRQEAATALALFLSQNPENTTALRMTAHWQIAGGDWEAAIDTLESLRGRLGNRDAALLAELAYGYAAGEDLDTAQVYAAAAYRLAPLNPAATDAYGWVLYLAGDGAAGIEVMEKAVAIAPRHGGLRWHLAQAYADVGRKAAARAAIQAALGDPAFGNRAEAQVLLKSLG
ncbi:MAG: tetratricopeptide repeat protein [Sphingomonas sp.]